jgi:transcriptional regulator with XRE-family HTH domain
LNGNTVNPRPETIHSLAKYFQIDPAELYENDSDDWLNVGIKAKELSFKTTKDVLAHLLLKTGILNTTTLHKSSGIPKSNLDRILNGSTENPSIKTLEQLANFFNLTVGQIKALEPIRIYNRVEPSYSNKMLPLITLPDVNNLQTYKLTDSIKYVGTTRQVIGDNSFAITIDNKNYEPDFKKGNVLIVDSSAEQNCGDFIVGSVGKQTLLYEYHYSNSKNVYVRPAGKFELITIDVEAINIHGVVVQEIINRKV